MALIRFRFQLMTQRRHRHRLLPILLMFASLVAICGGCSRSGSSSKQRNSLAVDSHQQMLAALEDVQKQSYRDTPYFGEHKALLDLRERLPLLDDSTPILERYNANSDLASMELEQGNVEQALIHCQAALSIFRRPDINESSLDSLKLTIAKAYLRLGENQNCCVAPNNEACIFPLVGGGLHDKQEGSRNALPYLYDVAGSNSAGSAVRYDARWLIPIAAMTLGEYPEKVPAAYQLTRLQRHETGSEFPKFTNIAPSLRLDKFSVSGAMVVDDFNGDGEFEIVNSIWDTNIGLGYYERASSGEFVDLSKEANFSGINGGLNVRHADFDNDGDLDLYVIRGAWLADRGRHPNSLLRNDGPGKDGVIRFTDVSYACGIAEPAYPAISAEWADYDLDGDLDLFVGNETDRRLAARCQLFRNDGVGENGMVRFVDVAATAGVAVQGFVRGVSWGDFNDDRYPDLFVSRYDGANLLFQNRGDGTFTDVAEVLGVTLPRRSFPAWFWDYDNDGHLDIFASSYVRHNGPYVSYYQGEILEREWLAKLYRNDGAGRFQDVTEEAGLEVPMMPMGSNFGDLDNDGYPDIYMGTGTPNFGSLVPNQLLMSDGGKRFIDRTVASGMGHLQKGHGVSFADFDRDGDLDVFEQMGGAFKGDKFFDSVFENPGFGNHWLEVRLKGNYSNSFGIGCRLRVVLEDAGEERSVYTWMNSGGSFGSNPLIAHLGLGKATSITQLEVFWPVTGITQILTGIAIDQRIVVSEGDAKWTAMESIKLHEVNAGTKRR